MRIQFCGADRTVTGTCHLIEVNGLRLLLDMGMYQGPREKAIALNRFLPDDSPHADALILSHGHLDHCGKLPVLVKGGYQGPIYCTAATTQVSRIVMEDAARIQEEDAEYLNRRLRDPQQEKVQSLYSPADVPGVLRLMRRVDYEQKVDLGKGVSFTLYDAGHILGSAYVVLEWENKKLLFTGDVGRYNTPILRDPRELPGAMDYVITESTYGNMSHGSMDEVAPQFLDAVKFCIDHRSRLLVPSFAVGRTQTVLWYMQRFIQEGKIPAIPIYVDSPMGVEISHIHSAFPENYDDETKEAIGKGDLFGTSRVTFASSPQQSKEINNDNGPCVIIASSPTCEFGRILHHLKESVERPNDVVVFVGWIPPATLGRRLQDGQKRVRILDRWYDVRCQVRTIHGLSAHADADELMRFLKPTLQGATEAFVVHGEVEQAETFAARLVAGGIARATVPAMESAVITPGVNAPPAPAKQPPVSDGD